MDPNNLPTNDDELKAAHIAVAEEQVTKLAAKVEKSTEHLQADKDALAAAKAELRQVKATEYVFEEPQESVEARA